MRPAGAGELARVTAEGLPPFTIHAYITTVPATHCHHSLHSTVVISSAVYHSRTDPKPVQSAGPEFESGFCVLLLVCTMKQPSHRRADCSLTPLRASGVVLVSASRQLATFHSKASASPSRLFFFPAHHPTAAAKPREGGCIRYCTSDTYVTSGGGLGVVWSTSAAGVIAAPPTRSADVIEYG